MKGIRNFLAAAVCVMLTMCFAHGATFPTAHAVEAPEPTPQTDEPQAQDGPASDDELSAYLFVHFMGDDYTLDHEQIYFSLSQDGTTWHTLNGGRPALKSTVGELGVRDPHIIRKHDNTGFYLIATDLSIYELGKRVDNVWSYCQTDGSKNIVVWESADLVHWTEPRLAKIARDNAGCTWAPESIWDPERNAYMVFWASRTKEDGNQRIYRSYTTDYVNFTAPEVYIEADESRIDTTFYYDEPTKTYYRFTKWEGPNKVYMEKSDSLSGDFVRVGTYRLNGQKYDEVTTAYEGPTVYKVNGQDKWCMLLDNWTYRPFETNDIAKGEFVSAGEFDFGGQQFRHGTVIPITQKEYNAMEAEFAPKPIAPSEGDSTSGQIVYSLDFEGDDKLASGVDGTAAATEKNGTVSYVEGYKGGNAVKFNLASNKGPGAYLALPGSVLADKKALTISFAAKVDDVDTGIDGSRQVNWLFLASASDLGCVYNNEQYMAGLWQRGDSQIVAQRWKNNNGRAPVPSVGAPAAGTWAYITIVYVSTGTNVYIDGAFAGAVETSVALGDILGPSPVFYLGHSMWGNGEGSTAAIDDFAVYDYALSAEQVAALYNSVKAA